MHKFITCYISNKHHIDNYHTYLVFKNKEGNFQPLCEIEDEQVLSCRYCWCQQNSKRKGSEAVAFFNKNFPHIVFQKRIGLCPNHPNKLRAT